MHAVGSVHMKKRPCVDQELFKYVHNYIVSQTVFILSSAAISYLTSNMTEGEDAWRPAEERSASPSVQRWSFSSSTPLKAYMMF